MSEKRRYRGPVALLTGVAIGAASVAGCGNSSGHSNTPEHSASTSASASASQDPLWRGQQNIGVKCPDGMTAIGKLAEPQEGDTVSLTLACETSPTAPTDERPLDVESFPAGGPPRQSTLNADGEQLVTVSYNFYSQSQNPELTRQDDTATITGILGHTATASPN